MKTDQDNVINILASFLESLSPYEFAIIGAIMGFVLSIDLTAGQINALGNWLEEVGQIMLTIAAKATASPTDDEYNALLNDVERLKREIQFLKNKIK
jgi:hypothetical protein